MSKQRNTLLHMYISYGPRFFSCAGLDLFALFHSGTRPPPLPPSSRPPCRHPAQEKACSLLAVSSAIFMSVTSESRAHFETSPAAMKTTKRQTPNRSFRLGGQHSRTATAAESECRKLSSNWASGKVMYSPFPLLPSRSL